MLKFNRLKIEVITQDGKFGREIKFNSNLNIIRGKNTSGKSTCLEAMIYALGLEELIGGKKEQTMKPVLREELEYNNKILTVIESSVYLEIENVAEKIITIKRAIKNESIDSRLVQVFDGPLLTFPEKFYSSTDMFLHDGGAASHKLGFHNYLEKFLGWDLPDVPFYRGSEKKLYLQTIFPALYIEQIRGWKDFLSTIPTYYGIINVSKRTIEFLLRLDVLENEKKKQDVKERKELVKAKWKVYYDELHKLSDSMFGYIEGIPEKPIIELNKNEIYIKVRSNGELMNLEEKQVQLNKEKLRLMRERTVGEALDENKKILDDKYEEYNTYEYMFKELKNEIKLEQENLKSLNEHLTIIKEDLEKNIDAKKLIKYGSKNNLSIANNVCPTCNQKINETLFSQEINIEPMSLQENIEFLKRQKKMIKFSIEANELALKEKTKKMEYVRNQINNLSKKIRELKQELITDERLPSENDIKKRINIESEIEKLSDFENEFQETINDIETLTNIWSDILAEEAELPKEYFSKLDKTKISDLERYFKQYLELLGYESRSTSDIEISEDKYTPTVSGFDMKFDASATDYIRAISAYTIALFKTSIIHDTNHPKLVILDEPGQHQMDIKSIKALFEILNNFKESMNQVIVATSLKDEQYEYATQDIEYNLIEIEGKAIHTL